MKWSLPVLGIVLCLILPNAAFGLSCAQPHLDKTTIDASVMIFEGIAGPKRSLSFREKVAVRMHAIKGRGGSTEDLMVYKFEVTRGWKATASGQSVDVLFNSHWGDGFTSGESYLVVIPQQIGNLFWSPLCGHTIDVKHAAKFGDLALLERVIGIGHHMKVAMADRACRRAGDCAFVQTHCGACSCGTPVAKFAAKSYESKFKRLCAVIRIADRCEMDCPPLTPSCSAGYCEVPE